MTMHINLAFGDQFTSPAERGIVMAGIVNEREHQVELGWTPEHDDQFGHGHLVNEAIVRLESGELTSRKHIEQAAALLVAALEVIDRAATLP